jgi:spore germination cell wall hydrolase CwlJ-like protein
MTTSTPEDVANRFAVIEQAMQTLMARVVNAEAQLQTLRAAAAALLCGEQGLA